MLARGCMGIDGDWGVNCWVIFNIDEGDGGDVSGGCVHIDKLDD